MLKTVILCALLAVTFAEDTTTPPETGGTKETIGKGYGNGYGGGNGYGPPPAYGPPQSYAPPPAYGPPQPPPAYGPPLQNPYRSLDSHYCSVHASFALALSPAKTTTPYGNNGGPSQQPPRRFTRQFCRYTAASTPESCNYCCTVAARAANTSPDEIFGAVFSFDPQNPTDHGAGYDGSQEDGYNNNGPYRKKRHATPAYNGRIPQCVCCAPKRTFL